ncbi:MAG: MgtC/SapB family protein [Candidatus Zixiibacteriota bacterium]
MEWNPQLQIIGQVAIAIVLGGIVGIEREIADKPAGLRTNMLVAGAAALLVKLGEALVQHFAYMEPAAIMRFDTTRIIEAIITGIAFLGAGTIIRRQHEERIEGLTTAATILVCATIGITVALEKYIIAGGVTLLALFILVGIKFIEKLLVPSERVNRSA